MLVNPGLMGRRVGRDLSCSYVLRNELREETIVVVAEDLHVATYLYLVQDMMEAAGANLPGRMSAMLRLDVNTRWSNPSGRLLPRS